MKKRILYIINPKSGINRNPHLPGLIHEVTRQYGNEYEIKHTAAPKHAVELSRDAAKQFDIIVAVGGDGSVNETAEGLMGSSATLGIIPTGSGNGLARHLRLSMNHRKAIETINTGGRTCIDTLKVNDYFCVGTMGIGFDGHIAHLFANASRRGYATYAKLVLKEFYKYKPKVYSFSVDGKEETRECFMLTIANSSQFGNNATIAPLADIQDGLVDISILRKFPFYSAPYLIWKLMHLSIHHSKYFEMMKGKEIVVKNKNILYGHIDGEAVTFEGDINVRVMPASLNVIATL